MRSGGRRGRMKIPLILIDERRVGLPAKYCVFVAVRSLWQLCLYTVWRSG